MITIIAAVSIDGFIGKDDKIPWRLKSDMEHFKNTTTGQTVVMGRKTWDSLGPKYRPLPDRRNIVLSRQQSFVAEGAEVVPSFEEALTLTENDEQVFIIGGAEIYRQAMPFAERLLITKVHKDVGNGDARFPLIHPREWNLVSSTEGVQGGKDECEFTVDDYSPNIPYIELANVRTPDQLKVMRQIRKAGHCPFCSTNLATYHKKPIIWGGTYWVLTENMWPYPGASAHYLLIARAHREHVGALNGSEKEEFFEALWQLERDGSFLGGGIGIRSGDPILSGATVKHLHAQIISPRRGSEPARFQIGTSKR